MKPCERCGGMILAQGEWTVMPLCGCPIIQPVTFNYMQGWECPRCHKILSPFARECDCPALVKTWSTTTDIQTKEGTEMRVVVVISCRNCPYNLKDVVCNYTITDRMVIQENELDIFPKWCPLPILEEKEEQK